MKRLFWDIENEPLQIFSWRVGNNISVSYDNIIRDAGIISISWKWQGDKKVHSLHWDKNHSDKQMIQEFVKVLAEADEVVAHWGDGHDVPLFRARALYYGIDVPPFKAIDTCKMARGKFKFASNKLDYLSQHFGLGQKIETGFGLWKAIVLDDCPKAMKKMCEYNMADVVLLEKVWEKLYQASPHKTHVGVMQGLPKWTCPRTGSTQVKLSKTRVTANGSIQYQMQCKEKDCGGYYSVNETAFRAYQNRP